MGVSRLARSESQHRVRAGLVACLVALALALVGCVGPERQQTMSATPRATNTPVAEPATPKRLAIDDTTGAAYRQLDPDVSGNRAVWSEWLETEDIDGIVEVVVVRDLKTGRTSTLTTSTGLEGVWSGRAAIDKDLVAWVEDGSIRMLDLSNRRTRTLRRNFEIDRLDVDDGRVVWSEGIDGDAPREIYLHDFSANETTLVVVSRGSEDNRSPALDGTHLVYLCDSKSDALGQQVYVRDLDTGQTRRISRRSPGEYATPRISGHRVIWRDYTDRPAIHLYNLRTNTERTVPTGAPDPQDPDIDGDIVVWCDARTGVSDVYGYDLVRERTYRVSRNKTYGAAMPRISGKRVVWWSPPDYGERVHWGKIDRKRVVGAK